MAVMNSIFSIGSIIMQGSINALGDDIIAAHLGSRKVAEMFMQPLVTIGTACSTFVGQNYGAGKIEFITAIVIPAPIIFLKSDEENLKSSFLSLIILKFFKITTKQKITDKSCAKTVATAAPITPIFVNLINT